MHQIPAYLQKDLSYAQWVALPPGEKQEREWMGLHTPKPTKGDRAKPNS